MQRRPINPDTQCSDPLTQPVVDKPAPFRPIPKCDPPVIPRELEYELPVPLPIPPPIVEELPTPYLFSNEEARANCESWPYYTGEGEVPVGAEVVIESGTFEESLYIQNLEIPGDDLYYIARIQKKEPALSYAAVTSANVEAMAELFSISQEKATLIADEVSAIQQRLLEQAQVAALAGLDCSWGNDERRGECPPDAIENSENPIVIPPDFFFSRISKEEANEQAVAAAAALLRCYYTHPLVEVVCSDFDLALEDLDPGNTSQPFGASPRVNPERIFVNYVRVEIGEFVSEVSVQDAIDQATAYALTQLDCFYIQPNDAIAACCDPPIPDDPGSFSGSGSGSDFGSTSGSAAGSSQAQQGSTDGSGSTSRECEPGALVNGPIEYDGNTRGNPIYLYAGYTVSDLSFEDAQEQAQLLAESMVDCLYPNDPKVQCCAGDNSVCISIPAGYILSEVSVDEANAAAEELVNAMLVCEFWNDELTVSCAGGPVMPGMQQSVTIPANTFSSSSSKEDAEDKALLMAMDMLTCLYCNDELIRTECPALTIPPCTIISSESKDDANLKSEEMMQLLLDTRQPCPGSSGGGGGGGGGGSSNDVSSSAPSSNGGGSMPGGSSKNTAIVPAPWSPTKYAALFTHEMPEVRFDDITDVKITGRVTRQRIDPKFSLVCELQTMQIISVVGDRGPVVCARVEGDEMVIEVPRWPGSRPRNVVVRLSAIRKGFLGMRFPNRTENQFIHNEAFLNSAYPKE